MKRCESKMLFFAETVNIPGLCGTADADNGSPPDSVNSVGGRRGRLRCLNVILKLYFSCTIEC